MELQLARAGYEVTICHDGPSGIRAARAQEPDLVLLDILLPKMDGWTVCERLQEIVSAPIVFTTALGADTDVSRGLEMGANDYIIKPFSYKELLARVKAALHRARRAAAKREKRASPKLQQAQCWLHRARRAAARRKTYDNGRLSVDLGTRDVTVDGEPVELTPLEYNVLAALVEEAGHVVPHQTLLRRVWGPEYEDRRQYLKLYIWYLRRKIEAEPSHPKLVLTERGVGYRLARPAAERDE
jgi:two-component system KDP operon response regulator KdpE